MIKKIFLTLGILTVFLMFENLVFAVSVTEFGADGSDENSDNSAFSYALTLSNDNLVTVPEGTYYIDSCTVPDGKALVAEEGANPIIIVTSAGENSSGFSMGSLSMLDGLNVKNGGGCMKGVAISWSNGVNIKNCEITGFLESGVYNDHGHNMTCENLVITDTATGINTVYASDITVRNSYIKNCSAHGIQFWNNWEGMKDGQNLVYEGNTVMDIGGGGIWGTGAERVVMRNNTVDNCGDVGLDLEYCNDSLIMDNYAGRCVNGGISLFYSCENVLIKDNTVYNNAPPKDGGVHAGIWLTDAYGVYDYDTGHRDIKIYDNNIYNPSDVFCGKKKYSGIMVGASYPLDVDMKGNKVFGNTSWIRAAGAVMNREFENSDVILNENQATVTKMADVYEFDRIKNIEKSVNGTLSISDISTGTGTYRIDFVVSSAANTQISAVDENGDLIATGFFQRDSLNEPVSLYTDLGAYEQIKYVITTEDINAKVEKISFYKSPMPLYYVLSLRHGIEYINNSPRKIKGIFILKLPDNKFEMYSIFTKKINRDDREVVDSNYITR